MNQVRTGGFSLVEVLVVAAIVSLLVALLMPVVHATRGLALQASCTSNIRQVGNAYQIYSADNSGSLPHEDNGDTLPPFGSGWYIVLKKYIPESRVFLCPLEYRRDQYYSYKMNSMLESSTFPCFRPARAPRPAETVLLFDGRIDNCGVRRAPKGTWNMVSGRHRTYSNILFLDLHSEYAKREFDSAGWKDNGGFVWEP